ncbi:MAG: cytidylate kinase family protein [Deltaproteobacteria bacterium]|nr:cytidylate kinase family protein [Deltaproteobacteria bacterium]
MAIITISYQAGSLGAEIARGLSADLGYKLIDREDFVSLAKKYDPELAAKLEKVDQPKGLGFFQRLFFSSPVYLSFFEALIFELASQQEVIIIGRGAQIVLADQAQVFRVRVVAPTHRRVLHMRQEHNLSIDDALEFINKHDRHQRDMVRRIFEREPRDWALYDMVLNTNRLDTQAGVNTIKAALKEIERLQPVEESASVLLGLALGKRVEAKVRQEIVPSTDIEVDGQPEGTVVLYGRLASQEDCHRAEEIASAQPGVKKVVNKTTVLPSHLASIPRSA